MNNRDKQMKLRKRIKWFFTSKRRKQQIVADRLLAHYPFCIISKRTEANVQCLQNWLQKSLMELLYDEQGTETSI